MRKLVSVEINSVSGGRDFSQLDNDLPTETFIITQTDTTKSKMLKGFGMGVGYVLAKYLTGSENLVATFVINPIKGAYHSATDFYTTTILSSAK